MRACDAPTDHLSCLKCGESWPAEGEKVCPKCGSTQTVEVIARCKSRGCLKHKGHDGKHLTRRQVGI